jgi:uncharacterized membrane protein YphA (DoxX/SURF4 family)
MNDTSSTPRRLAVALTVLRISLGGFLLLWALEKFFIPQTTVAIWDRFYLLPIGASLPYIIGGLEAMLSVAILVGLWRRWSYGLGLGLHTISVVATWKQLLDPWGLYLNERPQHLFLAGVPVLAAFVVLYMLRHYDVMSFDGKRLGIEIEEGGVARVRGGS